MGRHHKGGDDDKGGVVPDSVMNMCNSTCLTLEVSDFYGDGWDSVEFHGEEEGGVAMTMAPDCMHKKMSTQICPDHDGTYYFTAVHSNSSYIPENNWEVFWTATSHNCDGSVANVYTGGFNSSLILDYMGNSWSVQYWENLWDNEKKCDACGDAKRCKPKKPKTKKSRGKPGKGGSGGGKGGKPINGAGTSNTTKTAKPKPRYGPPAVNLRVTMYDEMGDGWWMNDYSGESWYLADDRREKLFHTGTLCDGSVGSCNLCLGDGSYTMRFTGEASNFTAWDFCGVTGQRAQELTFHVLKGKCYADSIVSLRTDCMGSVESHVTLSGVVAMSGFTSEFADKSTYSVVSNSIAGMISGFSSENVQVLSTSLDSRVMSASSVSNVVQDYNFEVTFIAEKAPFNTDGRSYAAVTSLASSIASTLSSAMSSGQFETKMQMESSLQNVVSLSSQAVAELVSLEVSSVTYVGTEGMITSTLPELSWSDYQQSYSESSGFESGVAFLGVAVVGFVAFVGIMSKGIKKYESLPTESIHHNEIVSSDMDSSISPAAEQSVFQVDATPIHTNNL
jgi:hypothetical protein